MYAKQPLLTQLPLIISDLVHYFVHLESIPRQEEYNCLNLFYKTDFLQALTSRVADYANSTFVKIKRRFGYRYYDPRSFIDLMQSNDKDAILDFLQNLENKQDAGVYKDFYHHANEIFGLMNYFQAFDEGFQTKKNNLEQCKAALEEYRENVARIIQLLRKTNYEPIMQLLPPYDPNPRKSPEKAYQARDRDNLPLAAITTPAPPIRPDMGPTMITDGESTYYQTPSRFYHRIYNYIQQNKRKLIIGAVVGGVAAAGGIVFWPVLPAIPVIGGIVLAGMFVGSFVTGVFHYTFSKQAREEANAPLRTYVAANTTLEPEIDEDEQAGTEQSTKSANAAQFFLEDKLKENVVNLLIVLDYPVPKNILILNELFDLMKSLKSHLRQIQMINMEIVTQAYLKNDNILCIDLKLLRHACLNNGVDSFDILKYFGIAHFAQLEEQTKQEHLKKLQQQLNAEAMKLHKFVSAVWAVGDNSNVAYNTACAYFAVLQEDAKKAQQLHDLYLSACEQQAENLYLELKRIRNVLIYFITAVHIQKITLLNQFSDAELLKLFHDTLLVAKSAKIKQVCQELSLKSSNVYNIDFLLNYLQRQPQWKSEFKDQSGMQGILNSIHLFLANVITLDPTFKIPPNTTTKQKIQIFYQKLDELPMNQVIKLFSELRFHRFASLDLQKFLDLIRGYYQIVNTNKLKQFDAGIDQISKEAYVSQFSIPLANVIKEFVQKLNHLQGNTPLSLDYKNYLPKLFEGLASATIDEIFATYHSVKPSIASTSADPFLQQLILNFIEYKRQHELQSCRQLMHTSENLSSINTSTTAAWQLTNNSLVS